MQQWSAQPPGAKKYKDKEYFRSAEQLIKL